MKADKTLSVFLLDRSGSMDHIWDDAVGAYASFLKDQSKEDGELEVVLQVFDTKHDTVHDFIPLSEAKATDLNDYRPRGMTALLDSIGLTINRVGEQLKKLPEDKRPTKIAFSIMTDGYENASTEFSSEKIKEMIQHQTDTYDWQFFFLGANLDAVNVAENLGIHGTNTMNFMPTSAGVRGATVNYSHTMSSYRSVGDTNTVKLSDGDQIDTSRSTESSAPDDDES